MKVDHTRDMVRLSMLDSVGDSTEDGSGLGSLSGPLPEGNDAESEAAAAAGTPVAAVTPSGAEGALERTPGLGRGEALEEWIGLGWIGSSSIEVVPSPSWSMHRGSFGGRSREWRKP